MALRRVLGYACPNMPTAPADISLTARYTAAVWARLGLPYASLFADRRGRALVTASLLGGRLLPSNVGRALIDAILTPRHLFMDEWIRNHQIEQVVEIAAGFSPRGLMFAAEGNHYIEIDRPNVMDEKQLRAASAMDGKPRPIFLGIDATAPDFVDKVLAACKPGLRTVVITEGFSMYFSKEGYSAVLGNIHNLAVELDAIYLTDFMRARRGRSMLSTWLTIGSKAVWFIADHVYFYCRSEAETKQFFQENGFEAEVHVPARERRYTNGIKPVADDLVYVVEAKPLAR
jgi:O-methyltransferase involved in polyketide biosynthesis